MPKFNKPAPDLPRLLEALDPGAPLVERHLWLIALLQWVRGHDRSVPAAHARIALLLDLAQARPELRARLRQAWRALTGNVDVTTLLADFGFAPSPAFLSELIARLQRKLLPATPETVDAAELFRLVLPHSFDAQWLSQIDPALAQHWADLLAGGDAPAAARAWRCTLLDAIAYCAGQISAAGYAPELRLRMTAGGSAPFHALPAALAELRAALEAAPDGTPRSATDGTNDDPRIATALHHLRARLDDCRHAAATVYTHLEDNGISVGLVFRLRQLRERVLRTRELLDCLLSPTPAARAAQLLAWLVVMGRAGRSVRALVAANSSLLAAKIAERSAETGEHYITRTPAEYRAMLRTAGGGGAVTALTTWLKFMVAGLGLSAFWSGLGASLVYAGSFVLIQLMHWTLATKQPAMTAPAMAAKLKDLGAGDAVEAFVDEAAHLVRSQAAAVLGNIGLVAPCVLALSLLQQWLTGQPMISHAEAAYVLQTLNLLAPGTLLFAAFTGVLLFACGQCGGWAENWFVLHRLDSALRYNPRITAVLGAARAARWARFGREQVSGLAANISLGFMLGLLPPVLAFFGIGLEARHVTLSTGQLAAAAAALGTEALRLPAFWWCVAAIPLIGALNLAVSFFFALRLALRAHNVSGMDRARIRAAIWARCRRRPMSFFLPW